MRAKGRWSLRAEAAPGQRGSIECRRHQVAMASSSDRGWTSERGLGMPRLGPDPRQPPPRRLAASVELRRGADGCVVDCDCDCDCGCGFGCGCGCGFGCGCRTGHCACRRCDSMLPVDHSGGAAQHGTCKSRCRAGTWRPSCGCACQCGDPSCVGCGTSLHPAIGHGRPVAWLPQCRHHPHSQQCQRHRHRELRWALQLQQ